MMNVSKYLLLLLLDVNSFIYNSSQFRKQDILLPDGFFNSLLLQEIVKSTRSALDLCLPSRGTDIPGHEWSLRVPHTANMQSMVFNRFSSPSLWIFIYGVTNFGRNPEQASSHLNWAFLWSDLLQGLLQDVYSFPSSYFILENHAVFLWFNDDKTQSIYQDESAH